MNIDPISTDEQMLVIFKALADANRLKIVGLLANQPSSVEELAGLLKLSPSTVSHHLAKLAEAGLVSARAESYYNIYRLERGALELAARRLMARDAVPNPARSLDYEAAQSGAYQRKVLRDMLLEDGRLKVIPAQRKKREIVLRYILQAFEAGRRYPEAEVVEILNRFHSDNATLRRELISYGMLVRQSGEYWRPEGEKDNEHPNTQG